MGPGYTNTLLWDGATLQTTRMGSSVYLLPGQGKLEVVHLAYNNVSRPQLAGSTFIGSFSNGTLDAGPHTMSLVLDSEVSAVEAGSVAVQFCGFPDAPCSCGVGAQPALDAHERIVPPAATRFIFWWLGLQGSLHAHLQGIKPPDVSYRVCRLDCYREHPGCESAPSCQVQTAILILLLIAPGFCCEHEMVGRGRLVDADLTGGAGLKINGQHWNWTFDPSSSRCFFPPCSTTCTLKCPLWRFGLELFLLALSNEVTCVQQQVWSVELESGTLGAGQVLPWVWCAGQLR